MKFRIFRKFVKSYKQCLGMVVVSCIYTDMVSMLIVDLPHATCSKNLHTPLITSVNN